MVVSVSAGTLAEAGVIVSVFPTLEKTAEIEGNHRVILESPQMRIMIIKKRPIPAMIFDIKLGFGVSMDGRGRRPV